jgi:hypothetical protein
MAAPYVLSMCNDSQWVRMVDAPKCIFNVPQSGRNTTRQLSLPDSPAFLCRLFEFIDFCHPNVRQDNVCRSCNRQRFFDIGWLPGT